MTQPRAKRPSWTELPPTNWAERQAHRIAGEITRLRGNQSAQWLADRTKDLGHEVSRSVISDLENGRRRYVTTAELTVLAAALNVSPVVLVYPGPYQNMVEILPGRECAEFNAAQWFSGLEWDAELVAIRGDDKPGEAWSDHTETLYSWRELMELEEMRGATLIVDDHDRKRALLYDKQIAVLRNRLGIADGDA